MKVFFLLLVAIFATSSGQNYYSDEQSEMSGTIRRKQFDLQSMFDKVVDEIKKALSGMLQGEASRSSRSFITQKRAAEIVEKVKDMIAEYIKNDYPGWNEIDQKNIIY